MNKPLDFSMQMAKSLAGADWVFKIHYVDCEKIRDVLIQATGNDRPWYQCDSVVENVQIILQLIQALNDRNYSGELLQVCYVVLMATERLDEWLPISMLMESEISNTCALFEQRMPENRYFCRDKPPECSPVAS